MYRKEIFRFYTHSSCDKKKNAFDFLNTLNATQLRDLELDLYRAGYSDDTRDIEWVQEAGLINCGDEYWDL